MKKILFALLFALILTSCNRQKTYTINGSFDIPEEISLGDTVIERGSLDGMYVYMVDLEGVTLDSVLVENETFSFTGKMYAKDAFFAYIICDYIYDIIVVEPGEIELLISENSVIASGTPSNDAINEFHLMNANLSDELEEQLMALSEQYNGEIADSLIQDVYDTLANKLMDNINSVYEANKDNLVGVYVVNLKTSPAQTVEQLEEMLEEYDEYITESQMINVRREYLRAAEANQLYYDMLSEEDEE